MNYIDVNVSDQIERCCPETMKTDDPSYCDILTVKMIDDDPDPDFVGSGKWNFGLSDHCKELFMEQNATYKLSIVRYPYKGQLESNFLRIESENEDILTIIKMMA